MKITIETLATALEGKLWIKGDMKRIYLDRGYNTKKMSTKTYVYEQNGEFKVSCYIDCLSQPFAWIKSQQEEVISSVENSIERAIKTLSNPEKYENMPYSRQPNPIQYLSDSEKIEIGGNVYGYVEKKNYSVKTISELELDLNKVTAKKGYDANYGEYFIFSKLKDGDLSANQIINSDKNIELSESIITSKGEIKSLVSFDFESGKYYNHSKFGNGKLINEDENTIIINFESVGEKKLIKKYVKSMLTPIS